MNTSALISYLEAELAQVDPKHRTLEVEMVIYGTINRVLKGMYAQKKADEAPPTQHGGNDPDSGVRPATAPNMASRAAAGSGVPDGSITATHRGKPIPVRYKPVIQMLNGKRVVNCANCNTLTEAKRSDRIYCGRKECRNEVSLFENARKLGRLPVRIQTRACVLCGAGFNPKLNTQVSCAEGDNKKCFRAYQTAVKIRSSLRGAAPRTPSEAGRIDLLDKIAAERKRIGAL